LVGDESITSEGGYISSREAEPPPDFRDFYEQERERLGRAMYLISGDLGEAEDLVQDAFVRVYERWDRVGGMESPVGYLYRTAMNLHRGRLRRLATAARYGVQPGDLQDQLAQVDDRERLFRTLKTLSASQRRAMVLTEWLGMDDLTAAKAMGIRASTLRVHRSRAMAKLRERLVTVDE
jgi:RNA polymerase sigma-70 factor, ECF subfamily